MSESAETLMISETPMEGAEQAAFEDGEFIEMPDDAEDESSNTEDDDDESINPFEDDDAPDDDSDEDDDEDDEDDEESDDEPSHSDASAQAQADAAAEMLSAKGIDYNNLVDEYLNGGLSDKSIQALEAAGYSKDVIDSYISGQEAKYEIYTKDVFSLVGGKDEYSKLCKWASKNLSKDEQAEFDIAVESRNMAKAKFAVAGLMARKQAATGKAPELLKGKNSTKAGIKPFKNADEIAEALEDSRYSTDPKYTKTVDARLMATPY